MFTPHRVAAATLAAYSSLLKAEASELELPEENGALHLPAKPTITS